MDAKFRVRSWKSGEEERVHHLCEGVDRVTVEVELIIPRQHVPWSKRWQNCRIKTWSQCRLLSFPLLNLDSYFLFLLFDFHLLHLYLHFSWLQDTLLLLHLSFLVEFLCILLCIFGMEEGAVGVISFDYHFSCGEFDLEPACSLTNRVGLFVDKEDQFLSFLSLGMQYRDADTRVATNLPTKRLLLHLEQV